ncbi:MAG: cytochrome c oxidase accessory protein CcoG [Thermoanaerobaculia bacterium]|nr:cytochrome c oxidase accessory protein CcoG [Thermoanaerobaculia bacterium]
METSPATGRASKAAVHRTPNDDFRDHLPTVDASGRRRWIYPRRPSGRLHAARRLVSWILLAVMVAGPWIRISGNPLLLFDLVNRRFSILGQVFWPHDTFIFAVAMLTGFLMIVLFTAVYGRVWCGWLCPQTVLMEMVFRKVEYWIEGDAPQQRRLTAAPWGFDKIRKRLTKHGIFFAISFVVGNLLLAYIIGSERLTAIVTESPHEHLVGLSLMILFTLVFYGIFARFREQACTFICPYGRFQSVLLDDHSIVVAYDERRGDPRARRSRSESHDERKNRGTGDCVDCHLCVDVCPTGIDIRNGTQMECVNCTACIDACDQVMDRVGFDTGLIRYASRAGIERGERLTITPRLVGYSTALLILASFLTFLLVSRTDVHATFLRNPGTLSQTLPSGDVANFYTVRVMNKTSDPLEVELRLIDHEGSVTLPGGHLMVAGREITERPAIVTLPPGTVHSRENKISVGVYSEGELLESFDTNFFAPEDP